MPGRWPTWVPLGHHRRAEACSPHSQQHRLQRGVLLQGVGAALRRCQPGRGLHRPRSILRQGFHRQRHHHGQAVHARLHRRADHLRGHRAGGSHLGHLGAHPGPAAAAIRGPRQVRPEQPQEDAQRRRRGLPRAGARGLRAAQHEVPQRLRRHRGHDLHHHRRGRHRDRLRHGGPPDLPRRRLQGGRPRRQHAAAQHAGRTAPQGALRVRRLLQEPRGERQGLRRRRLLQDRRSGRHRRARATSGSPAA